MKIRFEEFLKDVNMTKEEYFKLNPAFKYLVDNYSDEANSDGSENIFIMKDGTVNNLEECMEFARTNQSFLNRIKNPSREIIVEAIKKYPLSIRYVKDKLDNELIKIALSGDVFALKYIDNQTEEIVDFALSNSYKCFRLINLKFRTLDRLKYMFTKYPSSSVCCVFTFNNEIHIKGVFSDKLIQEKMLKEISEASKKKDFPDMIFLKNFSRYKDDSEIGSFVSKYIETVAQKDKWSLYGGTMQLLR